MALQIEFAFSGGVACQMVGPAIAIGISKQPPELVSSLLYRLMFLDSRIPDEVRIGGEVFRYARHTRVVLPTPGAEALLEPMLRAGRCAQWVIDDLEIHGWNGVMRRRTGRGAGGIQVEGGVQHLLAARDLTSASEAERRALDEEAFQRSGEEIERIVVEVGSGLQGTGSAGTTFLPNILTPAFEGGLRTTHVCVVIDPLGVHKLGGQTRDRLLANACAHRRALKVLQTRGVSLPLRDGSGEKRIAFGRLDTVIFVSPNHFQKNLDLATFSQFVANRVVDLLTHWAAVADRKNDTEARLDLMTPPGEGAVRSLGTDVLGGYEVRLDHDAFGLRVAAESEQRLLDALLGPEMEARPAADVPDALEAHRAEVDRVRQPIERAVLDLRERAASEEELLRHLVRENRRLAPPIADWAADDGGESPLPGRSGNLESALSRTQRAREALDRGLKAIDEKARGYDDELDALAQDEEREGPSEDRQIRRFWIRVQRALLADQRVRWDEERGSLREVQGLLGKVKLAARALRVERSKKGSESPFDAGVGMIDVGCGRKAVETYAVGLEPGDDVGGELRLLLAGDPLAVLADSAHLERKLEAYGRERAGRARAATLDEVIGAAAGGSNEQIVRYLRTIGERFEPPLQAARPGERWEADYLVFVFHGEGANRTAKRVETDLLAIHPAATRPAQRAEEPSAEGIDHVKVLLLRTGVPLEGLNMADVLDEAFNRATKDGWPTLASIAHFREPEDAGGEAKERRAAHNDTDDPAAGKGNGKTRSAEPSQPIDPGPGVFMGKEG